MKLPDCQWRYPLPADEDGFRCTHNQLRARNDCVSEEVCHSCVIRETPSHSDQQPILILFDTSVEKSHEDESPRRLGNLADNVTTSDRTTHPSVSIIIAARDNEQYLSESIESALQQTVRCEVIYSDDCSLDNSIAVARRYENQGLTVLSSPIHLGVCETRNRGVAIAHGEYLVHLDGDDVLTPDFVERHLQAIGPGVPFVYGPAKAFGDGPHSGTLWGVPAWEEYDLWRCNTVNTSAMYAKWAFVSAGGWKDNTGTMWDWDLAIRASRFGTPRPSTAVLNYRMHNTSWSAGLQERGGSSRTDFLELIRRTSARLSVGVIYSGRVSRIFPKWISNVARAVRMIDLPERSELVILDNSEGSGNLLEQEARKYSNVFSQVRILPHSHRLHWTTERMRRDRVAEFMAAGCNRLRDELKGDIHWLIEDDILVPPLGGRYLWQRLTAGTNPINAIAGCYRNRHLPEKYVGGWWNRGAPKEIEKLPADNSLVQIDFTGTGCLMYWKDRTPKIWNSHVQQIPAHDWEWGLALKAAGGRLFLDPEVRCGHVVDEQQVLEG